MKLLMGIMLLVFGFQNTHACIWQDGDSPFWPSNKIEVCFLSQDPAVTSDPSLVKSYEDARQRIQRVLNQQFNLRNTGFQLHGFKTCDYDHRTQGAKDNLPQMIRINLSNDNKTRDSVEITNGLIGPINGKKSVNVHLRYVNQVQRSKADKTKHWKSMLDGPHADGLILHEILHMFGIHHEHNWNDEPKLKEHTLGKFVKLGNMDHESIICVDPALCEGQASSVLSKGDIRCLQAISSGRIKNSSIIADDNKARPVITTAQ